MKELENERLIYPFPIFAIYSIYPILLMANTNQNTTITSEQFAQIKKSILAVSTMIESMESDLAHAKKMLQHLATADEITLDIDALSQQTAKMTRTEWMKSYLDDENMQIIEGVFDGYFMTGSDQKKYPVPLNYASKSKLVPGDKLKLRISPDGKLIYKLIMPTDRTHIRAVLSIDSDDETKYVALTPEWQSYQLNQAAVTYYKGRPGDEIYILTSKEWGSYAAIEAVIKK